MPSSLSCAVSAGFSWDQEGSRLENGIDPLQIPKKYGLTIAPVAVLRGDSKVSGTVTFEQPDENSPVTVSWNITGSDPNAKRGIHIHAFGDNTNGCTSAGPHCMSPEPTRKYTLVDPVLMAFAVNPHGKTHGAPEDEERHAGDLGNFETDAQGNSVGSRVDKVLKLIGPESILGVRTPLFTCLACRTF